MLCLKSDTADVGHTKHSCYLFTYLLYTHMPKHRQSLITAFTSQTTQTNAELVLGKG